LTIYGEADELHGGGPSGSKSEAIIDLSEL
jgi:hypothetical protein